MQSIARHNGIVTHLSEGKVTVKIETISACGSCEAHGNCGFAESKEREVEIETRDWQHFCEGDPVVVSIDHALGFLAVLFAYVMPAIVLLAAVLTLLSLLSNEAIAILISFAILAIYFVILYQFRDKLQKKFTFGLEPREI